MLTSENTSWAENVILIDADYADILAFNLSVQLERMLERRMPKISWARWMDYVALDGGLRPGDNAVQVLLLYSKGKNILKNFMPEDMHRDLDGQSFRSGLGEFAFASFPVEENVVTRGELYRQSVETLLASKQVKRLVLVPDMGEYGVTLKSTVDHAEGKNVILMSSEPLTGFHCGQEIITYSLMAALGVKGEEIG